jgi:uncharacterized repeat protein (TIGR03809 family)
MAKIPPRWPDQIARQWQGLAERRRQHLLELYRTGRWRRYYSEDQMMAQMRDASRDVQWWGSQEQKLATDTGPAESSEERPEPPRED